MQIKTPAEILKASMVGASSKIETTVNHPWRLFIAAIAAGIFIAIGGILSLTIGFGFPELTAHNPALSKLLAGASFPIGLILVVVLGAELFTGNNAMLIPAYMERNYGFGSVLTNWSIVYVGNFIGAVFFTYLFVFLPGLTQSDPWHSAIIKIGLTKTSMNWGIVLLKGIGANWFVCLGVWLALAGHNLIEKAFGCWLPVMAFVVLGYEHCIANMFYLPLAMMEGAEISVGQALWRNIIPATIGNIIGGAFFVGCLHWYLHKERNRTSEEV
ncbi:MAG: formate/nitrite transporter family protein [Muribaculaceae bacterium]|nr:formate/nitrite transporter family protein [Muribaculaceae bacterium]